jgi:hypothetical protein
MATSHFPQSGVATIGVVNGSTLPFIIFVPYIYALMFTLYSCPLSLALFFLLKTLLRESVVAFFLFSNVVYISSLVLLTLADGFCAFSF